MRQFKSALTSPLLLALSAFLAAGSPTASAKTTINIINGDSAGEGFNDTTAVDPIGGNTGTTVGEQRLIALQYAADIIGASLNSDVDINVLAEFESQGGNRFGAPLAAAGPVSVHIDFGGGDSNTWYVAALANKLAGEDLANSSDISAIFNSDVDSSSVLGDATWYYGLDANPSSGDIDFVTVSIHELLHGFGFISLVDASDGSLFDDSPDAYSTHVGRAGVSPSSFVNMSNFQRSNALTATGDLQWTGSYTSSQLSNITSGTNIDSGDTFVEIYAPNPIESGSTLSHFSNTVSPDTLMEPAYAGANHSLGLAAALLSDIGWGDLADLTIDVTLPSNTVLQNDETSIVIQISNNGVDAAEDVMVEYAIPNTINVISAAIDQGSCTTNTATQLVSCDVGTLNTNTITTATLTVEHTELSTITHSVEVFGNVVEILLPNNTASETVIVEDENGVTADPTPEQDTSVDESAGAAINDSATTSSSSSGGGSIYIWNLYLLMLGALIRFTISTNKKNNM